MKDDNNDFISDYKKRHNLSDEWERNVRKYCAEHKNDENKNKNSTQNDIYPRHYDHPNTLGNTEATILYLIVMFGGSIFTDRWIIWIVATLVWLCHITRHWET